MATERTGSPCRHCLATALRDQNTAVLDWRSLQESARAVWELFLVMRDTTVMRAWAGL